MKAVRINMNEGTVSKAVKALLIGTAVNAGLSFLITVVIALLLALSGNLLEGVVQYIVLIPIAVGGYTGGFVAARINKSNGLLLGVLSGLAILLVIITVSLCTENVSITYILFLKAVSIFLSGAVGGVKGVNRKEKLKIKP